MTSGIRTPSAYPLGGNFGLFFPLRFLSGIAAPLAILVRCKCRPLLPKTCFKINLPTSLPKKVLFAPSRLCFRGLRLTSAYFFALRPFVPSRPALPNHRPTSVVFFAFSPLVSPRSSLHPASHLDSLWLLCWMIFRMDPGSGGPGPLQKSMIFN